MSRFALPTQLFFLFQRIGQLRELAQMDLFTRLTVCDFLLEKDPLFARLTLSGEELHLYQQIYDSLKPQAPKPDLVIYLQAQPEILYERVRRRGVEFERPISGEYLALLADSYNRFFYHFNGSPVLIVNSEKLNFVVTDMPFGSYQESPQQAFRSAAELMAAGAQMVKLEGGAEFADTIRFLTQRGVPVCGHLGLTPQSVHQFGGYHVQGRGEDAEQKLIGDAVELEAAGAGLIVLEAIPAKLGEQVTQRLRIPPIGIGAGPGCSGQVLVLHDMLDVFPGKKARFVRNFMRGASGIADAAERYVRAVRDGSFPAEEHSF